MDDNIAALQEQLAKFQASLAESEAVLAPIKDEMTKLASQEHQIKAAYQIQMEQIRKTRTELDNAKYDAQVQFNSVQNEAKKIEFAINKAKEEAAAAKAEHEKLVREAERAQVLEKAFDNLTLAAPWREWAKDHQIKAGHHLTENRFVILADPMGLGKTLSSIITADMAEKATVTASPENPWMGVEEEVYIPEKTVWTELGVQAAYSNEWPFDGPLSDGFVHSELNVTITPFDDPLPIKPCTYRSRNIVTDNEVPYIPYDLRNKLIAEGFTRKVNAHYETQLTNSVLRPVGKKILYFCPAPLLRNVLSEWRRWAPHRNVTYIGDMTKGEREFALNSLTRLDQYVIICNYEAWRRDKALLDRLIECQFDTVIVDEAHNIKEMKTAAYKGVKRVISELSPEYVIPMTGTPILNRPQELFSILTLVNPKEFNQERDFLWKYCEEYWPDNDYSKPPKYKFKAGGLELLAKKLRKNFLRRTKDQAGIILPDQTVVFHELDRDDAKYPDQAKARKHMKQYATLVIDEKKGTAIQATAMVALITRLRQIETWPAGIIQRDAITKEITLQVDVRESQKIDYIIRKEDDWEGLIPDVVEEERVVVFSQFKAPLTELKERVEASGRTCVILDGDTKSDLRDEIRHDFDRSVTPDRSKAKWDVLLANYKAGGTGLNLTAATQVIVLDEEWSAGKRDQAYGRVDRIGQTEKSTVNVIRNKDTIDTWMAQIIEQKENLVNGFESAMLTMTDLKDAMDSGLL